MKPELPHCPNCGKPVDFGLGLGLSLKPRPALCSIACAAEWAKRIEEHEAQGSTS